MTTLVDADMILLRGTFIFEVVSGLLSFGLNIFIYVLYITSKQCRSRNTFFRTIVIADAFNGLSFLMAGLSRIQVLVHIEAMQQGTEIQNSECILRLFPIVLLIARLWPTLIFFIMGLESYLSVHYPLWFRDARIRKPPAIIFTGFFLLVALTIGYANAMFMSPYEQGLFTCDQNSTFGSNCGWWFDGFVIVANTIGLALTLRSIAVLSTPTSETLFGHNVTKLQQQRRTNTSVCAIGVSNCILLALPCFVGDLMILSETSYSYRYLVQAFVSLKPLCNLAVMMMSQDKLSEILSTRMLKCFGRPKRKNCVGYTVTYVTSGPLAFNHALNSSDTQNPIEVEDVPHIDEAEVSQENSNENVHSGSDVSTEDRLLSSAVIVQLFMKMPSSVLVTGANRGIGLGFVKQVLQWKELKHVFACCRNPSSAGELNTIHQSDARLHLIQMDVSDQSSISNAAVEVAKVVNSDGLNLLINNAGVLESGEPGSFAGVKQDSFLRHFNVNSVAPVIVSKEFLPLLAKAAAKHPNDEYGVDRAAIVNISSMLASIGTNTTGSKILKNVAYRMSKAALNQFTKSAAVDLSDQKILVVSFCPGWVKTDMGTSAAQLEVSESTGLLCETFKKLSESYNGGFYDRNGQVIPF